jgi:REP element-mobilizing transposase RayT
MPAWRDWVHVTCSTRGQWLPGDPRGFRDHDHRIHSSGNYKDFPPLHQHAGLRIYAARLNQQTIVLTCMQRTIIGEAITKKLKSMDVPIRIIAVAATHVHALIRVGEADAIPIFGRAKQFASHRVRGQLPGTIWGEGSHPERITDQTHYRNVVGYIRHHALDGAWIWDRYPAQER